MAMAAVDNHVDSSKVVTPLSIAIKQQWQKLQQAQALEMSMSMEWVLEVDTNTSSRCLALLFCIVILLVFVSFCMLECHLVLVY
jgi:hypothetical protein